MPTLNYIWIGLASDKKTNDVAAHDVLGPILMDRQLQKQGMSYQINFWCSNYNFAHYKKLFEEQQCTIIVRSIKDYLEEEKQTDLKEQAELVEKKLNGLWSFGNKDHVIDKDFFSLFLLLGKEGYILDTNVRPIPGKEVTFDTYSVVSTAKSGHDFNDFYFMYSPGRKTASATIIFDQFAKKPKFAKLQCFFDSGALMIDNLEDFGIKKSSYKSYEEIKFPGLLRYLEDDYTGCDGNDMTALETAIPFSNVNQQIKSPVSIASLSTCRFTKLPREMHVSNPANLPNPEDNTYIIYHRGRDTQLFFKSETTKRYQVCAAICASSVYDEMPGENGMVKDIFLRNLAYSYNSFFTSAPIHRHIVNHANGTALHHAVILNNLNALEVLLKNGANPYLKAQYKIVPDNKKLTFDVFELSDYLKREQIIESLRSNAQEESFYLSNESEKPTEWSLTFDPF